MLSDCSSFTVDQYNRDQLTHGTTAFPAACYLDVLGENSVSWHWHEELEAVFVAKGDALVGIGSETYKFSAGTGFFINSGVLHSYQSASDTVCHLHAFLFHHRLIGGSPESIFHQKYVLPLLENKSKEYFYLNADETWQSDALRAIEKSWQLCVKEPVNFELQIRSVLSELMAVLCSHMPIEQAVPDAKSLRNIERLKQMLHFIQHNYAEDIHTADIAQSASVSESECLRCFRTTICTTPIRYLREYRIECAAQLLAAKNGRIADVAFQCGFQDVSYFTKTFRELKGCTPKEYQYSGL
ncbi:MAG: AraC family transcriptional regulator [Dorea sp.]|nr:AraC family transcriptional regulator [Dorea sp.]